MADILQASMKIAASGLDAQSRRMRIISENLANVESTADVPGGDPYTRKTVTFEQHLDEAAGANLVKVARIGQDQSEYRLEHDPSHPAADENGNVKYPNVNLLIEMADMREANRSYEANLQVIKQVREMVSMTLDMLRR
ncbi:MAG: flagellar basal body rod protein FlgC [Hyphomicrobiales bacterium]|nr:flagellar basal body rod protein FlgC [Hyphomicrobiales bacterium]